MSSKVDCFYAATTTSFLRHQTPALLPPFLSDGRYTTASEITLLYYMHARSKKLQRTVCTVHKMSLPAADCFNAVSFPESWTREREAFYTSGGHLQSDKSLILRWCPEL